MSTGGPDDPHEFPVSSLRLLRCNFLLPKLTVCCTPKMMMPNRIVYLEATKCSVSGSSAIEDTRYVFFPRA